MIIDDCPEEDKLSIALWLFLIIICNVDEYNDDVIYIPRRKSKVNDNIKIE